MNEIEEKIRSGDLYALLSTCSADDLNPLVEIILGKLSNFLEINDDYKKYKPDHTKYYQVIANEIRLYGGNTFRNLLRGGEGPAYDEIVIDVCKKLDIPYEKDNTVANENNILTVYLEKHWASIAQEGHEGSVSEARNAAIGDVSVLKGFAKGGAAYLLLGWGGLAVSLADTAFKVTVPCVLHIAYLRKRYLSTLATNETISSTTEASLLQKADVNIISGGESLEIVDDKNREIIKIREVSIKDDFAWKSTDEQGNGISRLNPLLQAVPSLIVAGDVGQTRYMEVVAKGPLSLSKEIDGAFRGIVHGDKGIQEHANLFSPERLTKIVNAAALWQIASIVVAQKHLADINSKLKDLKIGISKVHDFQKNERKALLTGAIRYFDQVAPSVLDGEISDSIRNQIERHEADLLQVQDHLLDDIKVESYNIQKLEAEQEKIQSHLSNLESLYKQLHLCVRARACGWQLLLLFPGEERLKSSRRESIEETLNYLSANDSLVSQTEEFVLQKTKNMKSFWVSKATSNKNTITLKEWIQNLQEEIALCQQQITFDLNSSKILISEQRNDVKFIVKIEKNEMKYFIPA